MQDICREAEVSAGALYVYFASKEDLIAGIVDRDRQKLANQFAGLADAPDLIQALTALGEHYFVDEPKFKRVLHVEIGAESTRNPEVGAAFHSTDQYCLGRFQELFERAKADGRIAPAIEIEMIVRVMGVIGDGMFWRRAVDPDFDAKSVLPIIVSIVSGLLNPIAKPITAQPAAEPRKV